MLPWNSSPRFSARSQTFPEGRSSGSVRSADCAALWPWNTATRLHDVLPPRSLHCFIVPLSLTLRRAAALAGLPGSAYRDAIVAIELAVRDPDEARIRELLEAFPAWALGDMVGRAVDVHAVARGLDDRVRLGVDGRNAVSVLHHVPRVRTVRHAADRAVVP